jgi:hypothetical protein
MAQPHSFIGRSKPRVQMALNRLGQLVGGTLNVYGSSFVFRPGGTTAGNVFATWAELVAAASQQQGYKLVLLDDTYEDPTIPAGVWDLGGYTVMQGRQRGLATTTCQCTFEDGARLLGVYEFEMLELISLSDSAVLQGSDLPSGASGIGFYRIGKGTSITATGSAAFFDMNGGPPSVHFWLTEESRLIEDKTEALMCSGRDSELVVYAADRCVIEQNTLGTLPNAVLRVEYASVEAQVSKSHSGIGGAGIVSTVGVRLLEGSGSPEGSEIGSIGDLYVDRTTGGGRTLWVKETGNNTNTGWVFK